MSTTTFQNSASTDLVVACYQHVAGMLLACYEHAISMLPAYYYHVVSMLLERLINFDNSLCLHLSNYLCAIVHAESTLEGGTFLQG